MKEGCRFYEDLYRRKEQEQTPLQELEEELDNLNLTQPTQEGRLALDAPLTLEDLRFAAGQLNHNKSPGTDGLPPEFYVRFWDYLAPHLLRSYKNSIQLGLLSREQRSGVITLVPKEDVDRRLLGNWRLITLLNADYKILTKALALRLQACIHSTVDIPKPDRISAGKVLGRQPTYHR